MNEFLANAKANAMQVPSEIELLEQRVIELKPKTIVEIGTASGGTIGRWLSIPGVELVISIDLPEGVHGGQPIETCRAVRDAVQDEANTKGIRLHQIVGDSHNKHIASKIFLEQNIEIDFLFIDGDHTHEGVKQDFELYAPLVRDGGLIAFHDIRDTAWHKGLNVDVARFWAELSAFEREEIIADVSESIAIWPHTDGWGGIGLLRMDHATLIAL